jgi:putative Holliday junction resolvase
MAFARAPIHRSQLARDVGTIAELWRTEEAGLVGIGLPLRMDGTEGDEAARARRFGDALRAAGLRVVYEDERLTSWQAGEELAAGGRRPDRKSGELDSTAARLILQQYLDALPARPSADAHPAEETE